MDNSRKILIIGVDESSAVYSAIVRAVKVDELLTIEEVAIQQVERTIEEVGKLQAELIDLCKDLPIFPSRVYCNDGFIYQGYRPRMKRISSSKQRPRNWYAHRKTRRKLRKQSLKINRRKC